MKAHRIVSDTESAAWRNAWLSLGAIGGAVITLALTVVAKPIVDRAFPAAFSVAPPQILEQGPARTVIRVPTRRGDTEVICTIAIDHARRSYAVNC